MFHVKPSTESCVICGNQKFENKFLCKDHTVSGQEFGIFECSGCGFHVTLPRPSTIEIGDYYKSDKYVSHSNQSFGLMSIIYREVRKLALKGKYRILMPYLKGKRVLDIGCGTGAFLSFMQKKGFDIAGVEPDADARRNALSFYNIHAEDESFLSACRPQQFDLITMWHVLEHVMDLPERIQTIHRILKNDGLLCVAVPNPNSYDAKYYKEYWAAWDVPRHLWHFSPENISAIFSKYGFELIIMHPMKYDAFYVSILSEKYRGKAFSFLRGCFRGMISNWKAKNGTFSSQIYLLRKKGQF